jgi:hypothetical protein
MMRAARQGQGVPFGAIDAAAAARKATEAVRGTGKLKGRFAHPANQCCMRCKGKSCTPSDRFLLCGNDDGTLGCGRGMHQLCCKPPLQQVPEGIWFCEQCVATAAAVTSSAAQAPATATDTTDTADTGGKQAGASGSQVNAAVTAAAAPVGTQADGGQTDRPPSYAAAAQPPECRFAGCKEAGGVANCNACKRPYHPACIGWTKPGPMTATDRKRLVCLQPGCDSHKPPAKEAGGQ